MHCAYLILRRGWKALCFCSLIGVIISLNRIIDYKIIKGTKKFKMTDVVVNLFLRDCDK
jgi:hypothetical protein